MLKVPMEGQSEKSHSTSDKARRRREADDETALFQKNIS